MAKKVTAWESKDGKIFKTEAEADSRDKSIESKLDFEKKWEESIPSIREYIKTQYDENSKQFNEEVIPFETISSW